MEVADSQASWLERVFQDVPSHLEELEITIDMHEIEWWNYWTNFTMEEVTELALATSPREFFILIRVPENARSYTSMSSITCKFELSDTSGFIIWMCHEI